MIKKLEIKFPNDDKKIPISPNFHELVATINELIDQRNSDKGNRDKQVKELQTMINSLEGFQNSQRKTIETCIDNIVKIKKKLEIE